MMFFFLILISFLLVLTQYSNSSLFENTINDFTKQFITLETLKTIN